MTRIRSPRPFYEADLLIRPYHQFEANWALLIPIFCTSIELKHLYEIFYIPGGSHQFRYESRNASTFMTDTKWTIIAITKYLILELEYNAIQSIDLKPHEMIEVHAPQQHPKIQKDGQGSKLTLRSIYLTRNLDFVELLNEKVIMMGFKYNQHANLTDHCFENVNHAYRIQVSHDGYNTKYHE